jgi:hypothetical protein
MREALERSWPVIAQKFQGDEAQSAGRLGLANAIIAVTSASTDADDVGRMALDLLSIIEQAERDRLSCRK